MINNPIISVLICTYNREKYIAETIESVLESNYQNIEVIIVDDCSEDKTIEISRKFQIKDNRIKIYQNATNLGQFANRNKAASYARGKYLKYVDSDDVIYPHCLRVMVDAMEKYTVAGIGFDYFNYRGDNILPTICNSGEIYHRHFFLGGALYVGPLGSIYNRDYFNELGGFNPAYGVASDYEFNLRAALHKPVIIFQRDLYWYRKHDGQEINLRENEYLFLNYKINYNYLKNGFCPLSLNERRIALNNHFALTGRNIFKELLSFHFINALRIINKLKLPMYSLLLALCPSIIRNRIKLYKL